MNKECISKFASIMQNAKNKEYMFNLLAYSIAPILLGVKCGTIVSLSMGNKGINKSWESYGKEFLKHIKIKCYELSSEKDSYLLLFYDEKLLGDLILNYKYKEFLISVGYKDTNNLTDYLCELKERFKEGIPHEMGLFSGIPLKDVTGFINNNGENYMYCGYWKVYSDLEHTLNIFKQYSSIKDKVIRLMSEEMNSIEIIELFQQQGHNSVIFDEAFSRS